MQVHGVRGCCGVQHSQRRVSPTVLRGARSAPGEPIDRIQFASVRGGSPTVVPTDTPSGQNEDAIEGEPLSGSTTNAPTSGPSGRCSRGRDAAPVLRATLCRPQS